MLSVVVALLGCFAVLRGWRSRLRGACKMCGSAGSVIVI